MQKVARFSLGVRLSMVQALLIVVVLGLFTESLTQFLTKRLEKRTEQELSQQVSLLVNSMSSYHAAIADSAGKLVSVFRSHFTGDIKIDPAKTIAINGKATPLITAGGIQLNENSEIVDRFTSVTKAVSTVFVRSGDDFIRVSTYSKKGRWQPRHRNPA